MLSLPNITSPMHHSLSLTGLTVLKKASFKARHNIAAPFAQDGKNQIVRIPKKPAPKKKITDEPTEPKPKKERFYSLDKKQIRHRIHNFANQMKGEKLLFFWTVTFPAGTSDDTAYILLNTWLTRLRKEFNLKHYLWVAERQTGERLKDHTKKATNTIHFHLTFNQRICVKKANKFMRASIMHSINKGLIQFDRQTATRYNGIDIAKDRKTKRVINFAKKNKQRSLSRYLTEYVTKNESTFKKLAWHCSRSYSNLVTCVRVSSSEWIHTNTSLFFEDKPLFENELIIFYKWKGEPPAEFHSYLASVNNEILSQLNLN